MLMIDIADIKSFCGIYPESDSLVLSAGNTAQEIVLSYLRYDPHTKNYAHSFCGLGDNQIYLNALPLNGKITIDDIEYSEASFEVSGNLIKIKNCIFAYNSSHTIEYSAGFEDTNIPETIKHTIIQIASLLLAESGNVGISGKSDPNTGSRTFISYTNFDRYLKNLSAYRLQIPLK